MKNIIKLLLISCLILNVYAKHSHQISIAIVNGDSEKIKTLLHKPISKADKVKYLELIRIIKHKYNQSNQDVLHKKLYHFGISGILIVMGCKNLTNIYSEVESLDDFRKKIVVWELLKAFASFSIGIEKLYNSYDYYIKNSKYKNSIIIEDIVKNCITE